MYAVSPHLAWKPKSTSPSCVNHGVGVVPPCVDGNQAEVAGLSKKLSQANVSQDEHVIIPEHIRVRDSEVTHLIFGTFGSEIDPKTSVTTSHTVGTKEDFNDHSPSSSRTTLNSIISTDVASNDKRDHVASCSPLPQLESAVSVSEHQHSLTESVEDPSPGVVGEYGTNEMISSKVTHSQPQLQHQDNPAMQNFKFHSSCFMVHQSYESDSRYMMPFITKIVHGEAAQSTAYQCEGQLGEQPFSCPVLARDVESPASAVAMAATTAFLTSITLTTQPPLLSNVPAEARIALPPASTPAPRRSDRLASNPLNLTVRPSRKGEVLAMKRLGFLGSQTRDDSIVEAARKEYHQFFTETMDISNFPALRDLLPAARALPDDELMAAVRHAGTIADEL
nr:unnamed protein product [Digitaria exilis]